MSGAYAVAVIVHRFDSQELSTLRKSWRAEDAQAGSSRPALVFAGLSTDGLVEWTICEAASPDDVRDAELQVARLSEARIARAPGAELSVSCTASLISQRPADDALLGGARYVMAVPLAAPPEQLADIDRWYEEEHSCLLLRSPVWRQVLRYRVEDISGAHWSRLALHVLARPEVSDEPEVKEAVATPWRQRLAEHDWFLAKAVPCSRRSSEV